jgi:apolipoprotein N-acyltransferase
LNPSDPKGLRWPAALLVLLAGLVHALSMAWPFSAPWALPGLAPGQASGGLQVASLAVLVWQLERARTPGQGLRLGWWFALAMLAGTFWWLFISMHRYGGLPAALAVVAVLTLAGLLALYYAAAAGLYTRFAPRSVLGRAFLFAGLWLLAELARVALFTGFPWGEGGYAHVGGWARPLAAWVGVHGLTWLAAAVAAGLALLLFQAVASLQASERPPSGRGAPRARVWLGLIALLIAALGLAGLPPSAALSPQRSAAERPPLSVTLVQGNIPQDLKFQPGTGVSDALRFYGDQLLGAQTSLVVLPETALPLLPQQLPDGYLARLQSRFGSGEQAALIGMPLADGAGYSNSVVGLAPGAAPYRYDKHHLVPFGEFIPPFFQWFIRMMNIPLGDFKRGPLGQAPFDWRGERLAPNICYEDLFGEELGMSFKDPARAPTLLVNVSNIAWFGNTVAIDQHLHISRLRALEFARPMLRATNTGATVVINPQGEVTHALPRHTRGALVAEVRGVNGLTPYARWVPVWGLSPWVLIGGLSLASAFVAKRRAGTSRRIPAA